MLRLDNTSLLPTRYHVLLKNDYMKRAISIEHLVDSKICIMPRLSYELVMKKIFVLAASQQQIETRYVKRGIFIKRLSVLIMYTMLRAGTNCFMDCFFLLSIALWATVLIILTR